MFNIFEDNRRKPKEKSKKVEKLAPGSERDKAQVVH